MNNIECNLVAENLSAFIDQELDEEMSFQIKNHLCDCIKCSREFSKLLKLQRVMKNYFEKSCINDFKTSPQATNTAKITL